MSSRCAPACAGEPNEHGIEADLVFRARAPMIEEPHLTFHAGTRAMLDATRFTQHGVWEGTSRVARRARRRRPQTCSACATGRGACGRSASPGAGRPACCRAFFWLWAPVHFDDVLHARGHFESEDGRQTHQTRSWCP